jgi:antitoxin component YwqK of YwqJK toxin-antitoxin module
MVLVVRQTLQTTSKENPMSTKELNVKDHIQRHKDGSIWAKGQEIAGVPTGYWDWYRLDGTRMRSGHFENGEQVGEWITYDRKGNVFKVTTMKPKAN